MPSIPALECETLLLVLNAFWVRLNNSLGTRLEVHNLPLVVLAH